MKGIAQIPDWKDPQIFRSDLPYVYSKTQCDGCSRNSQDEDEKRGSDSLTRYVGLSRKAETLPHAADLQYLH